MRPTVKAQLTIPTSVQRKAGIKAGDRLKFHTSPGTITITAVNAPPHKPSKAELAAIQKGEADITAGRYVILADLRHELDSHRRRRSEQKSRKVSR